MNNHHLTSATVAASQPVQHDAAPPFHARPGFASGALCFSGTKIRVETLFNYLRDGGTIDQFIDEFDGAVSREQAVRAVETAAKEFVENHERRGFHKGTLISGQEVLRLVSDAIAFSRTSSLVIEEVDKLGASYEDYGKPIHGDRGWPAGIVWESLQTAGHFNLSISLELMLKALLLLDRPDQRWSIHKLGTLYDSLDPRTRNRLEAAWSMIDQSKSFELVAYVSTKSRRVPSRPKNKRLYHLREWFDYFDTDLQMYTKRYSWENIAKQQYRHYISDLYVFFGLFDVLRVLVLDRAKDLELLLPSKLRNEWRRSPKFLKSSVADLDSFYEKSGWHKDNEGRWTKRRADGNYILVYRPDLFWRVLIMDGENCLTAEAGRTLSRPVDLDGGVRSDPVLVAELMAYAQ